MTDQQTFTSSLKRLEEIVTTLERPDLELEDGLALLEEGVKLHRFCQQKLDQTQAKITQLLKDPVEETDEEPETTTASIPKDPWSKSAASEPKTEEPMATGTLFDANEDDGLPF